jgi:hypothetical protein
MRPAVMNIILRSLTQPITVAQTAGLAALIGLGVLPGYAAQSSLRFDITVQLTEKKSANPALCRSSTRIGAFGNTLTVSCFSGAVVNFSGDASGLPWVAMQDGAFRFVTSGSGKPLGTVDSYRDGRTVTSWRLVKLAKLEYLELMVSL